MCELYVRGTLDMSERGHEARLCAELCGVSSLRQWPLHVGV